MEKTNLRKLDHDSLEQHKVDVQQAITHNQSNKDHKQENQCREQLRLIKDELAYRGYK